jgi:hypothetical protein
MMRTFWGRVRNVFAFGAAGAAMSASLVSGCGGDDNGSPAADAAVDQTSDVAADTTQPKDSSVDVTQPDVMTDVTTDAPADVAKDSPADVTRPDAGEAVADASRSDADAGDGAVPACVTTVPALDPDAGLLVPPAKVLFDFDDTQPGDAGDGGDGGDAGDGGLDPHWQVFSDVFDAGIGSTATLGESTTDGYPCAGAIEATVTYTAFGPKTQLYYNFTNGVGTQDWTGFTALHAWVKVLTTDYSTIAGVESRVQSNNYAAKLFGAAGDGFMPGTTFTNGGWHEMVLQLTPGATTYVPAAVNDLQFELQTQGTAVDGGPAGPPQATMIVDSIWLE